MYTLHILNDFTWNHWIIWSVYMCPKNPANKVFVKAVCRLNLIYFFNFEFSSEVMPFSDSDIDILYYIVYMYVVLYCSIFCTIAQQITKT